MSNTNISIKILEKYQPIGMDRDFWITFLKELEKSGELDITLYDVLGKNKISISLEKHRSEF